MISSPFTGISLALTAPSLELFPFFFVILLSHLAVAFFKFQVLHCIGVFRTAPCTAGLLSLTAAITDKEIQRRMLLYLEAPGCYLSST